MFQRKVFVLWAVVFLVSVSAFSWEVTERYRLGTVIEGTTFITSGPHAGKAAFVDGWNVYILDLASGAYEKLFSVDATLMGPAPRGIAYLSQGEFAGNFILADSNNPDTLFLVSTSGSLVSKILAQDGLSWPRCEGVTQITSGPRVGDIAIVHRESASPVVIHIAIFKMQEGEGGIHAYPFQDIPLVFPSVDSYFTGITFLPGNSPHPNHFAVADVAGFIVIVDDGGNQETPISCALGIEGLNYIPSGPYQGSFLIADYAAWSTAIIDPDGSVIKPISIPVGMLLRHATSITWLQDRQQLTVFSRQISYWNIPMYLVSCRYPGYWVKDEEFIRTEHRMGLSMTDMTRNGTYYLKGSVIPDPGYLQYEIHKLDANFKCVKIIRLIDDDKTPKSFGRLIYVPGSTAADDRFLVQNSNIVYSFDTEFDQPPPAMDLSGKVTKLGPFCYDPKVRRYYVLDMISAGPLLRVFDQGWNPLAGYNISSIGLRAFSDITKITSGILKGGIAILDTSENELIVLNLEYDVASNLIEDLIGDVRTAGLKKGLANSLMQKLKDALESLGKKHARPAINQIEEFIDEVRAQRGKGIPAATAEGWLTLAQSVISGLRELL